jgi:hypothetical protein
MRAAAVIGAVSLAWLASACGLRESCTTSAGTETKVASADVAEIAFLTDLSLETGSDCDRLELTFASGRPGFRVGYEAPAQALTEDGSGRRLELEGGSFLVVRLEPAATARASAAGEVTLTYDGPKRLAGDGDPVAEVLRTGDFEAVVRWTIGLTERRPFSVRAEADRIVVEIG